MGAVLEHFAEKCPQGESNFEWALGSEVNCCSTVGGDTTASDNIQTANESEDVMMTADDHRHTRGRWSGADKIDS